MKLSNKKAILCDQSGFAHLWIVVLLVVVATTLVGLSVAKRSSDQRLLSKTSQNQTEQAKKLNADGKLASEANPVASETIPNSNQASGSVPAASTPKPQSSASQQTTTPKPQTSTAPQSVNTSPTEQIAPPTDPCATNKSVSPNSTVTTMWDKINTGGNGAQQVKDIYYNQQFLAQSSSCAVDGWVKASSDGVTGYVSLSSIKYN